jgi:hypothetical protein
MVPYWRLVPEPDVPKLELASGEASRIRVFGAICGPYERDADESGDADIPKHRMRRIMMTRT